MTNEEEVYDFLVSAGYKEPAVLRLGDRHVAGQWVPITDMSTQYVILRTHEKTGHAVKVLGEGSSWITVLQAAGLWQKFVVWKSESKASHAGSAAYAAEKASGIRQKTVKE